MPTQAEKASVFKTLHDTEGTFIMPNTWDIGLSKIITSLDFKAMATSSAAIALSLGLTDNKVSLAKTLQIHKQLCAATHLPISADFGYGFSDSPDVVYENSLRLANTGVVGMSIEDVRNGKVYSLELSAERIKAVSAFAKELHFPFCITARADNYFIGKIDLKDTITRLQSYQLAGADVLFAPGIKNEKDIKTILQNIDRPLNILIGLPGFETSIQKLEELGVKRISVGASLAKQVYTNAIHSLQSLKGKDSSELHNTMSFSQLTKAMN
jgi:2-methylisocitrate lyase-like PEP mutase family enzyme